MRYSSNFGLGLKVLMMLREALDWANLFCLYSPAGGLINQR